MKPVLKLAGTWLLAAFVFNSAAAEPPSGAVILQYHHVSESTPPATSISPALFVEHIDHLAAAGFEVLPLPRITNALLTNTPLPDKAVAITFDDAYVNIYETAWEELRRRDMPFTIFVATELVGSNDAIYMRWDQLREMAATGVHLANHTKTHAHLLRRDEGESEAAWLERVGDEITGAEAALDREIGGTRGKHLAYPYGEFDEAILSLVEQLGYVAYGQHSGAAGATSDARALPRFPLGGIYTGLASFRTKAASLPMPVATPMIDPTRHDGRPVLSFSLAGDNLRVGELACYGPGGQLPVEVEGNVVTVRPLKALPVGRSRYNCTMPSSQGGRFYWYSQLWIQRHEDGRWYAE